MRCSTSLSPVDDLGALSIDQIAQLGLSSLQVIYYSEQLLSVSVEMVLKDQSVNLVEQRLYLAIQIGDKLEPGVISRQLSRCTSVVCAAPDYLARWGVPRRPEALSAHNCLNHTRFGKNWHFRHTSANGTETTFDEVEVSGNFAANDSMVLLHAALAGDGIVHLPTFTTQAYLRSGALVRLFADYTLPALGIYALYSSRKYLPTNIRTLLDFLVDDMSETQCVDDPS